MLASHWKNYALKGVLRFFLTNIIGLAILNTAYLAAGTMVFIWLEGDVEDSMLRDRGVIALKIERNRSDLVSEVKFLGLNARNSSPIIGPLPVNAEQQFASILYVLLRDYQEMVTNGSKMTGYTGRFPVNPVRKWGPTSGALFAFSCITLIGYGHVTPANPWGQVAVILYSLLGVPLMLLLQANLGYMMAIGIRALYNQILCRSCARERHESSFVFSKFDFEIINDFGDGEPIMSTDLESNKKLLHELNEYCSRGLSDPCDCWVNRSGSDTVICDACIEYTRFSLKHTESGNVHTIIDIKNQCRKPISFVGPVPVSLMFFIIFLYLIFGQILFFNMEAKWTYVTSLYFSFVTISTIGLGDIYPGCDDDSNSGHHVLRVTCGIAYALLGLAILAMGISIAIDSLRDEFSKARKIVLPWTNDNDLQTKDISSFRVRTKHAAMEKVNRRTIYWEGLEVPNIPKPY